VAEFHRREKFSSVAHCLLIKMNQQKTLRLLGLGSMLGDLRILQAFALPGTIFESRRLLGAKLAAFLPHAISKGELIC
jgi:hypothetical protein